MRYGYDDRAPRYTVTDPKGQVYTTAVNAAGWTEAQTDPRGKVERFGYDAHGNLTRYTNRRGQLATFTYDELDRVLTRTADGATTEWRYSPTAGDAVAGSWIVAINGESRDSLVTNAQGQLVEALTHRPGVADSLQLSASYEPGGMQTRNALLAYGPWGTHDLHFGYDARFNLETLVDFAGKNTEILSDPQDRTAAVSLPASSTPANQLRMSYGYQASRLQSITYNQTEANAVFSRTYGYDVLDRIETITRPSLTTGRTQVRTLAYDPLGRLKSYQDVEHWMGQFCTDPEDPNTCQPQAYESQLRGETYSYDKVGNRTDQGATIETGNRLTHFKGYTLEYDEDGNLTRKSKPGFEQTFTWSTLGELTSVTTQGLTASFGYDALGRRARKTGLTGTTRYLWDEDDLVMEMDGAGAVLREYAYYPGIDQPHSVRIPSDQNRIYYYLPELPGHVAGLTSESHAVANAYEYTPFGESIPVDITTWMSQPLGYGARERDYESGMDYLRARYYDPQLGRFISEDPIGLTGGVNPYAYGTNDPVNATDPSGTISCNPAATVCLPGVVFVAFDLQSFLSRLRLSQQTGGNAQNGGEGLRHDLILTSSAPGGLFGGGGATGDRAKGRVEMCAAEHYGLFAATSRAATAGILPLAYPISKRAIGAAVIPPASELTTLIGAIGMTRYPGTKLPFGWKLFETTRAFGAVGRLASYAVPVLTAAQLAYDIHGITPCLVQ